MMLINSTADMLYQRALKIIMDEGTMTHPRGFNCKELSPFHLQLIDPCCNIVANPLRKINRGFAAAEFIWILGGNDDVASLDFYNSKIKQFSDDGVTFFGAYGPKYISQINYVVKVLKEDPWTRQAIINIWRENPPKTKDVPCTIMLHFIRRPVDTLNLIVYMRSQDCWLGLPYDLHNFTCIQIVVSNILQLKVGTFDLIQGSLHAYEQDFEKISKLISGPLPEPEYTPTDIKELMEQKTKWMSDYARTKDLRVRP